MGVVYLREATPVAAANQLYGIISDDAISLGSERDQAFLLLLRSTKVAVIKVIDCGF